MDHIQRNMNHIKENLYIEQNPYCTRKNRTGSLMAIGGAAALGAAAGGLLGFTGGAIVGVVLNNEHERYENVNRLNELHSFLLKKGHSVTYSDDYINKAKEIWRLPYNLKKTNELVDFSQLSREPNIEPSDAVPTGFSSRDAESMSPDAGSFP